MEYGLNGLFTKKKMLKNGAPKMVVVGLGD